MTVIRFVIHLNIIVFLLLLLQVDSSLNSNNKNLLVHATSFL